MWSYAIALQGCSFQADVDFTESSRLLDKLTSVADSGVVSALVYSVVFATWNFWESGQW